MATNPAIGDAVARLFTSAGRTYGKVECQLFMEGLSDITDDELTLATQTIIRREEWAGFRNPSPAIVRAEVRTIRARAALDQLALPPPRADKAEAIAQLAGIREALRLERVGQNDPMETSG